MKRVIISLISIIITLLVGWWLYKVITQINTPESTIVFEEAPKVSERTDEIGVKRIKYLAKATQQTPVEYQDYVYLGGEWGLLVGNKANHDFQQYVTQNPVRKVTVDDILLQYEEWNEASQTWEFKTINLKAYNTYLEKQ